MASCKDGTCGCSEQLTEISGKLDNLQREVAANNRATADLQCDMHAHFQLASMISKLHRSHAAEDSATVTYRDAKPAPTAASHGRTNGRVCDVITNACSVFNSSSSGTNAAGDTAAGLVNPHPQQPAAEGQTATPEGSTTTLEGHSITPEGQTATTTDTYMSSNSWSS